MSQAVRLLAAIGIFAAVLLGIIYLKPCTFGTWDFLQYWTAAKIVLLGANPYDPQLMHSAQSGLACDRSFTIPVLFWNPPLALGLVMPLAFMSFEVASAVWMFISVVLLVMSMELLFRTLSIPANKRSLLMVLLVSVPGVYLTLWWGQISLWLLFGFALFIHLSIGRKIGIDGSFLAGLSLSLTLIKPHLLFLPYLFLLITSVRTRRFRTIVGLIVGGLALGMLSLIFKPDIWSVYWQTLQSAPPFYWKTASFGSYFQELFDGELPVSVARFVPIVIATILSLPVMLKAFRKGRELQVLLLLTCLSLLFSPYGWAFDQVLLIPVIVFMFAQRSFTGWPVIFLLMLNLLGLIATNFVTQEFFVFYSFSITLLYLLVLKVNFSGPLEKLSLTRP